MQASKQYSPNTPSTTIKTCTGCKFYKPILTKRSGLCTLCGDIDLITGTKQPMLALHARQGPCGEEARFYVPGSNEPPAFFYHKDLEEMSECVSNGLYGLSHVLGPIAAGMLFVVLFYAAFVPLDTIDK